MLQTSTRPHIQKKINRERRLNRLVAIVSFIKDISIIIIATGVIYLFVLVVTV